VGAAALAAALIAVSTSVSAQDTGPAAKPGDAFSGVATVDNSDLGEARGGDSSTVIVSSEQNMKAGVKGASFTVGTMQNGPISVGNHAYDGYHGVGVNVLNTGNNNAFTTGVSMSVTLQ